MSLPALGGSVTAGVDEAIVDPDALGVDFVTPADRFARTDSAGTRSSAAEDGSGSDAPAPPVVRLGALWRAFLGRGAMTIRAGDADVGEPITAETALQLDGDLVVHLDPSVEDPAAEWMRHVALVRAHLEGVRLTLERAVRRIVLTRGVAFGGAPVLSMMLVAGTAGVAWQSLLALAAWVAGVWNLAESAITHRGLRAGADLPSESGSAAKVRSSPAYNYLLMTVPSVLGVVTATVHAVGGDSWWAWLFVCVAAIGLIGLIGFLIVRVLFLGARGKRARRWLARGWGWARAKLPSRRAPAVH